MLQVAICIMMFLKCKYYANDVYDITNKFTRFENKSPTNCLRVDLLPVIYSFSYIDNDTFRE